MRYREEDDLISLDDVDQAVGKSFDSDSSNAGIDLSSKIRMLSEEIDMAKYRKDELFAEARLRILVKRRRICKFAFGR